MYQEERPISDSPERLQPPATTRFDPDSAYIGCISAIFFLLCGMVLLLAGFVMTVTIDVTQFKLIHQTHDRSGAQTVATSVVGPVFLAFGTIVVLGGIAKVYLQQKRGQQDAEGNPRRPWRCPSIPAATIGFLLCGLILLVLGLVMAFSKHRLRGLPAEKPKHRLRGLSTEKPQAINTWPVFLIVGSIMVLGGIDNVRTHLRKSSSNNSSASPPASPRTSSPSLATTAHSRHGPRSGSGRHFRRSRLLASHDSPSALALSACDSHVTPTAMCDSVRVDFAVSTGVVTLASNAAADASPPPYDIGPILLPPSSSDRTVADASATDASPPPYGIGPILLPPSSSDAPPSYDAVIRQQSQTLPAYDVLFTPNPRTVDEAREPNAAGHPDQLLPTYEEVTSGLSLK